MYTPLAHTHEQRTRFMQNSREYKFQYTFQCSLYKWLNARTIRASSSKVTRAVTTPKRTKNKNTRRWYALSLLVLSPLWVDKVNECGLFLLWHSHSRLHLFFHLIFSYFRFSLCSATATRSFVRLLLLLSLRRVWRFRVFCTRTKQRTRRKKLFSGLKLRWNFI